MGKLQWGRIEIDLVETDTHEMDPFPHWVSNSGSPWEFT